jgi:ubiquinone/menaquinone biosynthesis C-methylase UbiE
MDEAEFDKFANEYSDMHRKNIAISGEGPEYFAEYKIIDIANALKRLNFLPDRVMDFGAGVGNSVDFLTRHFPSSDITLLDPSKKSLEIAEKRFPNKATFQHFDGVTIPFSDDIFDLVFTACVFHHIPEAEHIRMLSEIRRVLKPGGQFFIFEHNPNNPLTKKAVHDCPFDENAALVRASTLRSRLRAAGLSDCKVRFRIFFPNVLRQLRFLEPFLTWLPFGAQYYLHAQKRFA